MTGLVQPSHHEPRTAPALIFGPALQLAAFAIVVSHNHPSGDPTPSAEDRLVTDRLRQAGELLHIEVLDHVVSGADRYFSFGNETMHPFSFGGSSARR